MDETSALALLRRHPARLLAPVAAAKSAAMGSLMMVMSRVLTVAPDTPFRQSLAIITTDPSMHVTVPVGIGTAVPRD